ncbi:MAG: poly(A) polymerase [Candidatus Tokpelaia sp. JSC161]|nr:MAG: poly(A) polymerase [Candidatus Tokpelaia sp. JSC161]
MKCFSGKEAPWLFEHSLQRLLNLLSNIGEEARIVGGAIRDTLLKKSINDIDIATTSFPEKTLYHMRKSGFHVMASGINFGTITVTAKDKTYEITTLRSDTQADGRYTKVLFRKNWKTDAERRDFTINALYSDKTGQIYDDIGGLEDIENRVLRFIGNSENRIKEDFLRILRFFRFYACLDIKNPHREGIQAIGKLKNGLKRISSERIWKEMKKLLSASNPIQSLLQMHKSGVLPMVFPDIKSHWISSIHALIKAEQALASTPDPLLRLICLIPADSGKIKKLANHLKFSNAEKKRLIQWADSTPISLNISYPELKNRVYREEKQATLDQLYLSFATIYDASKNQEPSIKYVRLRNFILRWTAHFPLKGVDLIKIGMNPGPQIGEALKKLEAKWIQSNFQENKNSLISLALKSSFHDQ